MVFFGMAPLSIAVLNEASLPTKNPEDRVHFTSLGMTTFDGLDAILQF